MAEFDPITLSCRSLNFILSDIDILVQMAFKGTDPGVVDRLCVFEVVDCGVTDLEEEFDGFQLTIPKKNN